MVTNTDKLQAGSWRSRRGPTSHLTKIVDLPQTKWKASTVQLISEQINCKLQLCIVIKISWKQPQKSRALWPASPRKQSVNGLSRDSLSVHALKATAPSMHQSFVSKYGGQTVIHMDICSLISTVLVCRVKFFWVVCSSANSLTCWKVLLSVRGDKINAPNLPFFGSVSHGYKRQQIWEEQHVAQWPRPAASRAQGRNAKHRLPQTDVRRHTNTTGRGPPPHRHLEITCLSLLERF